MPVRINVNSRQITGKVTNAWQKGLYALTARVREDCNLYCKEGQHTLIDSSYEHSKLDEGLVIWQTPYARRQYWEIKTSLTPGRTWKWCEKAKKKFKKDWQRMAEKGLRDNL